MVRGLKKIVPPLKHQNNTESVRDDFPISCSTLTEIIVKTLADKDEQLWNENWLFRELVNPERDSWSSNKS
ncbi:hypothetical protein HMPREF9304_08450 [Hoylesella timonensis S9-PR14]|uniref:Uncharacterized protein n=1 Tax=Hoylesella timonensis S9-PR14 TaxID=1401062 RepID=A0A098YT18_9BACT|nr:hypothetical protein HMPREF9304_08450 [Hoylesella timonensis S9-PR14]